LGTDTSQPIAGYVTVRAGDRPMALAVQRVEGVGDLALGDWQALDPIFAHTPAWSEAVGVLATQLVSVLRAARLVPAEDWARIGRVLDRHARPLG
jgi:hypothetical protein